MTINCFVSENAKECAVHELHRSREDIRDDHRALEIMLYARIIVTVRNITSRLRNVVGAKGVRARCGGRAARSAAYC